MILVDVVLLKMLEIFRCCCFRILRLPFILINSLSKETSLLVLLNVFLFACSSIKASKVVSGGTKRDEAMFCEKHKHVFSTEAPRNPFECYVLIG